MWQKIYLHYTMNFLSVRENLSGKSYVYLREYLKFFSCFLRFSCDWGGGGGKGLVEGMPTKVYWLIIIFVKVDTTNVIL
jgi:hypothetical protein